jgi:hypothetical protein
MNNRKITFGDLNWDLQVAVIVSWIYVILFALGFAFGFIDGFLCIKNKMENI